MSPPKRPELFLSGPATEEQASIGRHAEHVPRLAADGVMLMAGRTRTTTTDPLGLAVFVAEDEARTLAMMESDPAVATGVMTAEQSCYRIASGNAEGFLAGLEAAG